MSYRVRVEINTSDFDRKFAQLMQNLPIEMQDNLTKQLAEETRDVMKSQAPRGKTGWLRGSITYQQTGRGSWVVYPLAPQAMWVNYGTRPHPIYPRRAGGRLVFYWEKLGRRVSLPMVNHPGQKQNPFVARTYQIMYRRCEQLVREAWERVRGSMG